MAVECGYCGKPINLSNDTYHTDEYKGRNEELIITYFCIPCAKIMGYIEGEKKHAKVLKQ